MKKTIIVGSLSVIFLTFGAHADNLGGVVNFKGVACGIAPDKEGATVAVDFGQVSKSRLSKGAVDQKNFSIKLTDCDVTNLKKGVAITFSGNTVSSTTNELATSGSTGTAIQTGKW